MAIAPSVRPTAYAEEGIDSLPGNLFYVFEEDGTRLGKTPIFEQESQKMLETKIGPNKYSLQDLFHPHLVPEDLALRRGALNSSNLERFMELKILERAKNDPELLSRLESQSGLNAEAIFSHDDPALLREYGQRYINPHLKQTYRWNEATGEKEPVDFEIAPLPKKRYQQYSRGWGRDLAVDRGTVGQPWGASFPEDTVTVTDSETGEETEINAREIYRRNEIDPDQTYLGNVSFDERWMRLDQLKDFFGNQDIFKFGPLAPPMVKASFTSQDPTVNEIRNILRTELTENQFKKYVEKGYLKQEDLKEFRKEQDSEGNTVYVGGYDPDAEVKAIPGFPELGIAIRSDKNLGADGKPVWVTWGSFRQNLSDAEGGGRPGETSAILDDVLSWTVHNAPSIALDLGLTKGYGTLIRNYAKNRAQKKADLGKLVQNWRETGKDFGIGVGEVAGFGIVAGAGTAIAEYGMLLKAKEAGIQPDMTFGRMMDESMLAAMYAMMGGAAGEGILRTATWMWRGITGKGVPRYYIERLKKTWKETYGGKKDLADTIDLDVLDPETSQKLIQEFGEEGAEMLKELAKTDPRTFANVSGDELLQKLEHDLLSKISEGMEEYKIVEALLAQEGKLLGAYFEALSRNSGDKVRASLPTMKEFQDFIKARRTKELETERVKIEQETQQEKTLLDTQIDQTLDSSGRTMGRAEAAEEIQKQEQISEVLPDYRNEIHVARDAVVREADDAVTTILRSPEYSGLTKKSIALSKFIAKPLLEMFKNPERIARSLKMVEAEDLIKSTISMQDGRSVLAELLGVAPKDQGKFIGQLEFNLEQLIDFRNTIRTTFGGQGDRVVRQQGNDLIAGIDASIKDLLDRGYKLKTGKSALPSNIAERRGVFGQDLLDALENQRITVLESQGRYLNDLIKLDAESMADYVLRSSEKNIQMLWENPAFSQEKKDAVQNLVLDKINRLLKNDNKIKQRQDFHKFLNSHEDQLKTIFPEETLSQFKGLDQFQETISNNIKLNEQKLRKILSQLEAGDTKDVSDIVFKYLTQSADSRMRLRYGDNAADLKELSDIADEFPQFRQTLQNTFKDWMVSRIAGMDYQALGTEKALRILGEEGGFDLTKLLQFAIAPYGKVSTRQGTEQFAQDLSLLLGEKEGRRYATHLRNLAFRVKRLNDRVWAASDQAIVKETQAVIDQMVDMIAKPQNFFTGRISKASRRISMVTSGMAARAKRYMLMLVADPKKLDEFMKQQTRSVNRADFLRLLANAAYRDYEETGAERQTGFADADIKETTLESLTDEREREYYE